MAKTPSLSASMRDGLPSASPAGVVRGGTDAGGMSGASSRGGAVLSLTKGSLRPRRQWPGSLADPTPTVNRPRARAVVRGPPARMPGARPGRPRTHDRARSWVAGIGPGTDPEPGRVGSILGRAERADLRRTRVHDECHPLSAAGLLPAPGRRRRMQVERAAKPNRTSGPMAYGEKRRWPWRLSAARCARLDLRSRTAGPPPRSAAPSRSGSGVLGGPDRAGATQTEPTGWRLRRSTHDWQPRGGRRCQDRRRPSLLRLRKSHAGSSNGGEASCPGASGYPQHRPAWPGCGDWAGQDTRTQRARVDPGTRARRLDPGCQ